MAAVRASGQPETVAMTESMRRFSLISQNSSRGSWREKNAATSTNGSNFTVESSSNSSRPSMSEAGRRRSSLASFSSVLKKSKRKLLSVSLENDIDPAKQVQADASRTLTLGDRFIDLPAEIHTIILTYLSISELLSFRRVSKSCLTVIQANSSAVARNALQQVTEGDNEEEKLPADFLIHLYPSTFSSTTTDAYFLRTLRRKLVISRQMKVLLTFIQTRVYMLKLTRDLECEHFAPYRPGLRQRLYRPVGYLQHLLETIRHLVVRSHPRHLSPNLTIDLCPTCMSSLKSVIASYPSELLVPIYQVIQLLVQHLRNATRSPSSVTAFERKLRGWSYGPPPEEHMAQLIMLGGIQELGRIDEMQGSYGRRLSIVKSYVDVLAEAARINAIAFPDIYKTKADPVMAPSSPTTKASNERYKEDLRTAIEARADDQPPTKSLDCNLTILTEAMLSTVPRLDTILIGPNTPLAKRIKKEKLIEHDRELLSPYGWVTKLMADSYAPEDIRALRPDTRHDDINIGSIIDHDHYAGHHHIDPGAFAGGHGGHWGGGDGGGGFGGGS